MSCCFSDEQTTTEVWKLFYTGFEENTTKERKKEAQKERRKRVGVNKIGVVALKCVHQCSTCKNLVTFLNQQMCTDKCPFTKFTLILFDTIKYNLVVYVLKTFVFTKKKLLSLCICSNVWFLMTFERIHFQNLYSIQKHTCFINNLFFKHIIFCKFYIVTINHLNFFCLK